MTQASMAATGKARYELRYLDLFDHGHAYVFPCDARGQVDLDTLSDRGRNSYFYARAVVGRELAAPLVKPVD